MIELEHRHFCKLPDRSIKHQWLLTSLHHKKRLLFPKESNLSPSHSLGPATNLQELGELFMNMQIQATGTSTSQTDVFS